jgi:hypothetical protein
MGYGSCVHGPYPISPAKPVTVATLIPPKRVTAGLQLRNRPASGQLGEDFVRRGSPTPPKRVTAGLQLRNRPSSGQLGETLTSADQRLAMIGRPSVAPTGGVRDPRPTPRKPAPNTLGKTGNGSDSSRRPGARHGRQLMKYLIWAAGQAPYLNAAIRGGEFQASPLAASPVASDSMSYLCGRWAPRVRAHSGSSERYGDAAVRSVDSVQGTEEDRWF